MTIPVDIDPQWVRDQVHAYVSVRPRYEAFGRMLKAILESIAFSIAPAAIVQTRTKGIASFAEKIIRKRSRLKNPVTHLTDLCGARVIVPLAKQLTPVCDAIEKRFTVDRDNTDGDVSSRLNDHEFGYRSIHFVITLPTQPLRAWPADIDIPSDLTGLKAEIQVRTILEHAWSELQHDLEYKSGFAIPRKWRRDIANLAAVLENIDQDFTRLVSGLATYHTGRSTYKPLEEIVHECDLLQIVLDNEPGNLSVARRLARQAVAAGDFERAVGVLRPLSHSGDPGLLADLGRALCDLHAGQPNGQDYHDGQVILEKAVEGSGASADAIAELGLSWERKDTDKAGMIFQRAFQADPTHPRPLSRYLTFEVARSGRVTSIIAATASVQSALRRSREWIDVGLNLPETLFDKGLLQLMLGQPYDALNSIADGVRLATASRCIEDALFAVLRLQPAAEEIPGWEWVRRWLLLVLATRNPHRSQYRAELRRISCLENHDLDVTRPVIFLVGSCGSEAGSRVMRYRDFLLSAFADYHGTIISGGTRAGVSGLAGELKQEYDAEVFAIGYVPSGDQNHAAIDTRYDRIIQTSGDEFSPMQPLQAWIDLTLAGVDLRQVRVIGLGGGRISATEYRMAMALGATVAILEDSGGEADRFLEDRVFSMGSRPLPLPLDEWTLRMFLASTTAPLEGDSRECLGREIHDIYRRNRREGLLSDEPSMADWNNLPTSLQESNRQQADDIVRKLEEIGCSVHPVVDRSIALMTFTSEEVEKLAIMEHARWNLERLRSGWRWGGTKDVPARINPYLVAWDGLPEEIREYDRQAVRAIPGILAKAHLEIRRGGKGTYCRHTLG